MTNTRKAELRKAFSKVDLTALMELVEEIRDEEQEKFDNLPESVQDGERGERMSEIIDALDNVATTLEEANDYINELDDVAGLRLTAEMHEKPPIEENTD